MACCGAREIGRTRTRREWSRGSPRIWNGCGNLQALFTLAALGQRVNVDLWRYETEDGRSLRKALDFLADYADPEKAWPYQDLKFDRRLLIPLLQQGAEEYGATYRRAVVPSLCAAGFVGMVSASTGW